MSPLDSVVENRLQQASKRWKSLLFLQRSSTLGAVVMLVILLLGAGNVAGVVSGTLATIVMVLTGIVAAFSWRTVAVGIRASAGDREQLARAQPVAAAERAVVCVGHGAPQAQAPAGGDVAA